MAGQPTRYACSVGPGLVKLTVTKVHSECTVNEWIGKTVPPRTSRCSSALHELYSTADGTLDDEGALQR